MNELYIDIGNSFIKAARQKGLNWQRVYRGRIGDEKEFYSWLQNREVDRFIVCSVVPRICSQLTERFPAERLRILRTEDIPRDKLLYQTPKTFGMDRFLTCYGAAGQTSRPVVVIDSGSACTVDFMTEDGVYRGGVIMPGVDLMIEALSRNIPSLPKPDYHLPDEWPGTTTLDSLRWGTTGAFWGALQNFLGKFETRFGKFDLFVTGGGTELIQKLADREGRMDLKVRPYLIFEGMVNIIGSEQ
ncbi:MAG: type III pantothenate kinase [Balneolaceae bacterium]